MVACFAPIPGSADGQARVRSRADVLAVTFPAEPQPAQPGLMLRTLGHACLALYRHGETPLLITDPWLVGSVYWRSWWLQNYPTAEEVDWLA